MKITVDRKYKKSAYTIGKMYIDGVYFCDTLEDKDRGLKQTDSLATIRRVKVAGQTAIPTGTYKVTLGVQSPKYSTRPQYAFCNGYVPRLLDVKGYEGILIHIGNTNADTSGCLLVGRNTEVGKVLSSTVTFTTLYAKLKSAYAKGEGITITIK